MKDEFLKFVKALINENQDYANSILTDEVKMYMQALESGEVKNKPIITDNGKIILAYMKNLTMPMKSADIATGMGIASRSVSGAMRKLVEDGFVEGIGDKSKVYVITEKGKTFNID